jgi:hypothetical protein
MNLMRGIDLKKIAGKMNGASGAELKVCLVYRYMPENLCFAASNSSIHDFFWS